MGMMLVTDGQRELRLCQGRFDFIRLGKMATQITLLPSPPRCFYHFDLFFLTGLISCHVICII